MHSFMTFNPFNLVLEKVHASFVKSVPFRSIVINHLRELDAVEYEEIAGTPSRAPSFNLREMDNAICVNDEGDVSICDAEILDELTTSRGELNVRNLSFKEDKHAHIESFNRCGESCAYFNKHLKANNILLNENGMAKLIGYGLSIIVEDIKQEDANGEGVESWYATSTSRCIIFLDLLASTAERNTSDCGKWKLTTYKDPDVFETYSQLCTRNVKPRYSSDLPQAAGVN
ncbi:boron transporter 4-like protein, partial [Tanacetum coccineum]